MIKQIIKCLTENAKVNGWLINEKTTETSEQFYVIHRLETTRATLTTEYNITVYHRFEENGNKYLGSSSFVISHKLKKTEIDELINDAIYAAKFIKNKEYQLVKGLGKKTFKGKNNEIDGFELLNKIAKIFIDNSTELVKFNSLELFNEKTTTHIVNSEGVNLQKTLYEVQVESIPSFNGKEKVELYKMFKYSTVDFEQVEKDVKEAIADVTYRSNATLIKDLSKIDVILRHGDAKQLFYELIADYSYIGVYKQSSNKKIGDTIQKNIQKDALTIGIKNKTKYDAFDGDGVLVNPVTIIEKGVIKNYFGNNQYACYLGLKPTGGMSVITVNKGTTSFEQMSKKPHLEVIALSGIQIENYSDYVGGEVRLALYFDGKNTYPVSGFSFSGSIEKSLETITLSKETASTINYEGPKYIKLNNMDIL